MKLPGKKFFGFEFWLSAILIAALVLTVVISMYTYNGPR
jgi:hypothetical protein